MANKRKATNVHTFRFDDATLERAVKQTKAPDKTAYIRRALVRQLLADKIIKRSEWAKQLG